MAASPHVFDVTQESFQTLVLEASHRHPVLVDYWAEWCAPCRALAPILERVADAYGGKLTVAKLNTEEQRDLAARHGIRSLPTVRLFLDGQPVDEFLGAMPEAKVRAFVDRFLVRESDLWLDQAEVLLGDGDLDGAARLLDQTQGNDAANPRLPVLQARLQVAQGDLAGAAQTLASLDPDQQQQPEVLALRGQLAFYQQAQSAPPAPELEQRLLDNPADSEARYLLAVQRVVAGDIPAALELLLELLRRDRKYGDDAARATLLRIFELLGGSGELVSKYRAKMTSILF